MSDPILGLPEGLAEFLLKAKRRTYAAGAPPTASSRPSSKDLGWAEGEFRYLDSYFGSRDFLGEEVVLFQGKPVWGMNYHGLSLVPEAELEGMVPCLLGALMEVPLEAPYRGPARFALGDCEYRCRWEGSLRSFAGEEEIRKGGRLVYSLRFHGGAID